MKVLIVEDDPHASLRLSALLNKIDASISILGICQSVKETSEWLKTKEYPDLIFLDIQLSDGISFELINISKIDCPIIFVTAFDNYAIEAFKVNSIDYILKPYTTKDLKKAIDKYKDLYSKKDFIIDEQVIAELKNLFTPNFKSRFFAKINHTVYSIATEDILYFSFEDNATILVNNENRSFVIHYSLDALEGYLDPKLFFRISRKFIIKIDSIKKMNMSSKSRIEVVLKNNAKEYVSRAKTKDFKTWLDI
jgi:DNA-binding LytR/AlgR family response regulator